MASLLQIVEQLALTAANATTDPDAALTASPPPGLLHFVGTVFRMLFSASALRDWAVLLVIGSLFETARRLLSSLWSASINAFFITAVFDEDDISFRWIMYWLSRQPSWKGARNVEISTENFGLCAVQLKSGDKDTNARNVAYVPAVSESYTLWYKYHWMGVTRTIESYQRSWTREVLTISIMTRDHEVLAEIIRQAKHDYSEAQKNKIVIYASDKFSAYNGWKELATRPKRPLKSIILDPGIADLVIRDVQDFLDSKKWYAERGIPFRRGYLLYGAPGSGKTSLIHSIAGELGLNVYIVSLSRPGLDDGGLAELISTLPERCIALIEDIDAAFHHGLSRESSDGPTSNGTDQQTNTQQASPLTPTGSHVSLSGLLNALDGIGAQEGRVLFVTTNKYSSLDPALYRPGRMDLHIEFKPASRLQAEELFKQFYAPSSSPSADVEGKHAPSEKHENGHADVGEDSRSGDLIDLSESQSPTGTAPASTSLPPPSTPPSTSLSLSEKREDGRRPAPSYAGFVHNGRVPGLSHDRIAALAAQFALAVPERRLSMASLQGFLMTHKSHPTVAVADVGAWVEKELAERSEQKKGS